MRMQLVVTTILVAVACTGTPDEGHDASVNLSDSTRTPDARSDSVSDAPPEDDGAPTSDVDGSPGDAVSPVHPCDEHFTCLAEYDYLPLGLPPAACNSALATEDTPCLSCILENIDGCAAFPCEVTAQSLECVTACAAGTDFIACLGATCPESMSDQLCAMSYVHAGVCNDVLEVCGEIHTPNYCDACEELHMECIPDSPALRCGDCLSGFVRVGGSCVPTGACDEDTCGPNGLCTGPNGYCLCEPGFAYQDSTPCVDAFVTNSWVDIIPPGGTGMFWQGSDLWDHTSPCHPVEINEAYGMLQYEVTREEYKRCVKAGACPLTACSITGPEDSDPQSSSASCARSSSR